MSLVPLIERSEADAEQAAFMDGFPPLNLFRAAANAPGVGQQLALFGRTLLFESELDSKVREVAILRVANLAANRYEIGHHERIGRDVGLDDQQIADTRQDSGRAAAMTEAQLLAARWAEQAYAERRVGGGLVKQALGLLGPKQTVELELTVGYYLMVASFLETFEIPFEGAEFKDGVQVK